MSESASWIAAGQPFAILENLELVIVYRGGGCTVRIRIMSTRVVDGFHVPRYPSIEEKRRFDAVPITVPIELRFRDISIPDSVDRYWRYTNSTISPTS